MLGEVHTDTLWAETALLRVLRKQGKIEETRPLAMATLQRLRRAAENPNAKAIDLNNYAWQLLIVEPADLRDPAAALPIAQKAVEKSGGEEAAYLDTLAKAWFDAGDFAKAVETQEKVVGLIPPGDSPLRTELEATLARYRAATTQPAAGER